MKEEPPEMEQMVNKFIDEMNEIFGTQSYDDVIDISRSEGIKLSEDFSNSEQYVELQAKDSEKAKRVAKIRDILYP